MLTHFPGTHVGKRKLPGFKLSDPRKRVIPPPESSPWWWHPDRVGVTGPPQWFDKQLKDFDPDLRVTWNRYEERWYVWMRHPKLVTRLCWGWKLLFCLKHLDGSYCPLDNRLFAKLYDISASRWSSGIDYFRRIEAEMERDREKRVVDREDNVGWHARDFWQHTLPQISMCGPSNGSKFANNN